ncbi:MAG: UDP-N-acetylmuramate dehydrogenase [Gammaproteobacteria bacterium]|nr:MAG: UDP-N-acetylmuramate dehydrogenase [Gammaproteobacteria bacterium]
MLDIQSAVSLQTMNTLALSASAEYCCRVVSLEMLQEALGWARDKRLQVTVLGGGSNVILADDIPGLVIAMAIPGMTLDRQQAEQCLVRVGAGENWHQLVLNTLSQGWFGLENLSLIPGLAGAAPIQNIGAYGVELSEHFHSLDAIHINTGEPVTLSAEDCRFAYRDSFFKHAGRDQYVITSLVLSLSTQPSLRLDYPALQQAIEQRNLSSVTPEVVSQVVCDIRRSKLPDPRDIPNVGSFFKNPVMSAEQAKHLQRDFPDVVSYPQADGRVKLAAGWLVDQAGWKGVSLSHVGVHQQQALVLTNRGGNSEELLALANDIIRSVQSKFAVTLELEPRVYP